MMNRAAFALSLAIPCALSACAQSDGIDAGGAVYDGIEPTASITLMGTEPFWGLEIKPVGEDRYTARFTHPEDIDGSVFAASRFAGNNGLGFSGTLGERDVQVALTPGDCGDGMSDNSYPFTATVALGDATLFGCAYTSDQPFTGPDAP
ncbi:MAG: hypothetical protein AAFR64_13620 [Pseudomonadota bacterium]